MCVGGADLIQDSPHWREPGQGVVGRVRKRLFLEGSWEL